MRYVAIGVFVAAATVLLWPVMVDLAFEIKQYFKKTVRRPKK